MKIVKEIIEKKKSYTLLAEEMKLKSAPLTNVLNFENAILEKLTTPKKQKSKTNKRGRDAFGQIAPGFQLNL